jgi:hypothetical protein
MNRNREMPFREAYGKIGHPGQAFGESIEQVVSKQSLIYNGSRLKP